jgi:hypothetical protein
LAARDDFTGRAAGSAATGGAAASGVVCAATTLIWSFTLVTPFSCVAILYAASRAASSGTWPASVTTPPLLETSMAAFFSVGSENIFALMLVVIVSSLGAPSREHDAVKLIASNNASVAILFLRIFPPP